MKKASSEWEKLFSIPLAKVVIHITDEEYMKNYHESIMKTRQLIRTMGKVLNRDFTKKISSWSKSTRKYVQLL